MDIGTCHALRQHQKEVLPGYRHRFCLDIGTCHILRQHQKEVLPAYRHLSYFTAAPEGGSAWIYALVIFYRSTRRRFCLHIGTCHILRQHQKEVLPGYMRLSYFTAAPEGSSAWK